MAAARAANISEMGGMDMRLDLGGFAQSVAGAQDMHRQRQLEELDKRMAEMRMQAQQFALQHAQAAPYLDARQRMEDREWWQHQFDQKTQAQVEREQRQNQNALELFRQQQNIQAEQAQQQQQAMIEAISSFLPGAGGRQQGAVMSAQQDSFPSEVGPAARDYADISPTTQALMPRDAPVQRSGQPPIQWGGGAAPTQIAQSPDADAMRLQLALAGVPQQLIEIMVRLNTPEPDVRDLQKETQNRFYQDLIKKDVAAQVPLTEERVAEHIQTAARLASAELGITTGADLADAEEAMQNAQLMHVLSGIGGESDMNEQNLALAQAMAERGATDEEIIQHLQGTINPARREVLQGRIGQDDITRRGAAVEGLQDTAWGTAMDLSTLISDAASGGLASRIGSPLVGRLFGIQPSSEPTERRTGGDVLRDMGQGIAGLFGTSPDYIAEAKGNLADLFGARPAPQQAPSPYLTGDLLPVDMAAAAQRIHGAEAEDAEGLSARALEELDWLGVRGKEALLKARMGVKGVADTLKERIAETGRDVLGAPAEAIQALEDVEARNIPEEVRAALPEGWGGPVHQGQEGTLAGALRPETLRSLMLLGALALPMAPALKGLASGKKAAVQTAPRLPSGRISAGQGVPNLDKATFLRKGITPTPGERMMPKLALPDPTKQAALHGGGQIKAGYRFEPGAAQWASAVKMSKSAQRELARLTEQSAVDLMEMLSQFPTAQVIPTLAQLGASDQLIEEVQTLKREEERSLLGEVHGRLEGMVENLGGWGGMESLVRPPASNHPDLYL